MRELQAYELIEEREIKDLNSTGYLLKHKKSGARIMILSNDDENKVFSIGFRTPPADSAGLPHILEHSVLCGSKKFPVKDPFVELVKGSLNTFLNAMTYPDKTLYPIASCNDKDFQNLMHVYMDAVFFTNIYEREEIFRQEGWHYELESEDAPLSYNGVVYNEMKGAFSSPEGVLDREIISSLYPDTSYANESGGDPEYITDLKYSEFLNFHSKYYHPSNSYIYLYGNMKAEEKLIWLDEEYLCKYDAMEIDSKIKMQKPFEKPVEVYRKYSITNDESEDDNTYLSYNASIGTSLDRELYLAFQILEYALLSAPGAPLKQILLDKKIGKDIMGSYDNGVQQPIFSIIAKNSNLSLKEEFIQTIRETLRGLVKNGIDKKALKAGINFYEFKYREADFGSYPKGLMYGLQAFDSWLYDENKPFIHIEANATFEYLKNKVETGYFEELLDKYLLRNNHVSIVVIEPERGLTAKQEKAVEEKLQAYKNSLSKEEIQKLVEDTKNLIAYQEEETPQADLEKIPMLTRADIKKTAAPLYNKEHHFGETKVLHHDLFTNGIGYLNLLFDVKCVPEELIPYVGILRFVLGYMDTENYSYADLFNEINMNSGGIHAGFGIYADSRDKNSYKAMLEVRAKVLYEKLDFAFDMIKEILLTTKLEDEKRLYEIIAQLKSRLQMNLTSSGHTTASTRAMSYFSKTAKINDLTGGIAFYELIEKIEGNFEGEKAELIKNLRKLMKYIFTSKNLMVDYTADEKGFAYLEKEAEKFKSVLYKEEQYESICIFDVKKQNEGFKTSSQVQYVCRAGNFLDKGYQYTGALKVLKLILSYDYLWNNIRVKGGAYGCMSGFGRLGDSYFTSYRDPNLGKTNEIYEMIPEYIRNFEAGERDMTKYIIGTISDLDIPMNPSAKGLRSLSAYLNHLTEEDFQKERDEILNADAKEIRKLADLTEAVLEKNYFCVVGSEEKIEEEKELFMQIKNLIHTF